MSRPLPSKPAMERPFTALDRRNPATRYQHLMAQIERATQLDITVTEQWDDEVEPAVLYEWEARATGMDTNKPNATGYSSFEAACVWSRVGPFDALDKLAVKLGVELEQDSIENTELEQA
jgi:hypothetical protein